MGLATFENRLGKPLKTEQYSIIPVEQSFQVQPPGMRGFFFWRKPSSVIVQYPDGRDEVIEIPDPTRQAQISILGFAFLVTFTIGLFTAIRARNLKKE